MATLDNLCEIPTTITEGYIEEFECDECGKTFIAAKGDDRTYCEVHRD